MAQTPQHAPATALRTLLSVAGEAADWMCEAHEGTAQHERGVELRKAITVFQTAQRAAMPTLAPDLLDFAEWVKSNLAVLKHNGDRIPEAVRGEILSGIIERADAAIAQAPNL
ncbi:hypothetical protein [Azospirillum himalayense]|uniref:Uncharacterized protein n=1 Tax=Azospirillum himalayense TaxID=654847 RepID=A0ABW0GC31_9PROT